MSKWDLRFMGLAREVSSWSQDPKRGVGAVIKDQKNRVVSLGFNGFPRDTTDDASLYLDREEVAMRILHAEQNAITFAKTNLDGFCLHVTHYPCPRCSSLIVQTGIKRVVSLEPDNTWVSRHFREVLTTRSLFLDAGVEFIFI